MASARCACEYGDESYECRADAYGTGRIGTTPLRKCGIQGLRAEPFGIPQIALWRGSPCRHGADSKLISSIGHVAVCSLGGFREGTRCHAGGRNIPRRLRVVLLFYAAIPFTSNSISSLPKLAALCSSSSNCFARFSWMSMLSITAFSTATGRSPIMA